MEYVYINKNNSQKWEPVFTRNLQRPHPALSSKTQNLRELVFFRDNSNQRSSSLRLPQQFTLFVLSPFPSYNMSTMATICRSCPGTFFSGRLVKTDTISVPFTETTSNTSGTPHLTPRLTPTSILHALPFKAQLI